jgi:drug/metabolite transporter (DMT)-like permease
LTPIFVIITGAVIYKQRVAKQKIIGVATGLLGSVLLFSTSHHHSLGDVNYAALVVLATIFYGININMVKQKLHGIPPTFIASFAFASLIIPSALILYYTGFFALPLNTPSYIKATAAACVLGVIGTALAAILLYKLVNRTGGVFASMVAYGIPFVAIIWGKWYGEAPTIGEICSLFIVLGGVYLANKPVKSQ